MGARFDPAPAAELLAAAWRNGERIVELPREVRPGTLGEGYDVQDRLLHEMKLQPSGWKLGVASRSALRQAGLPYPIAGRVLSPYCLESGQTVALTSSAPVLVELEIAFVLSDDVEPGRAPARPADVVEEARVTIELLQSRFVDFRAAGLPSFAADNAGFRALVVGEAAPLEALGEVVGSAAVLADGEERARARSGDELIDGLESLAGLFAHARERGVTLRRGEIVSTGSFTAPFAISAYPAQIEARYLSSVLLVAVAAPGAGG
jgi:2-keto-4-pentenoate hydratase